MIAGSFPRTRGRAGSSWGWMGVSVGTGDKGGGLWG